MAEVALGKLNKAIACDPGVSESTVKVAGTECCDLTDAADNGGYVKLASWRMVKQTGL